MGWMSSELERPVEGPNLIGFDDEFDSPGLAGDAAYKSPLLQANQRGIDGGGGEFEKTLEIGMTGSHPTLVAHDVFSDEGQELPLLAGRAAGEGRRGWVSLGPQWIADGQVLRGWPRRQIQ